MDLDKVYFPINEMEVFIVKNDNDDVADATAEVTPKSILTRSPKYNLKKRISFVILFVVFLFVAVIGLALIIHDASSNTRSHGFVGRVDKFKFQHESDKNGTKPKPSNFNGTKTNQNNCSSVECQEAYKLVNKVMLSTADPCSDFYDYACGNFEETMNSMGYNKSNFFILEWSYILPKQIQLSLISTLTNNEIKFKSKAQQKVMSVFKTCTNPSAEQNAATIRGIADDFGGFRLERLDDRPVPAFSDSLAKSLTYSLSNGFFKLSFEMHMNYLTNGQVPITLAINEPSERMTSFEFYAIAKQAMPVDKRLVFDRQKIDKVAQLEEKLHQLWEGSLFEFYSQPITIEELAMAFGAADWNNTLKKALLLNDSSWLKVSSHLTAYDSTINVLKKVDTVFGNYSTTADGQQTLHNYLIFKSIYPYYDTVDTTYNSSVQCFQLVEKELSFATGSIYEDSIDIDTIQNKVTKNLNHMLPVFHQVLESSSKLGKDTKNQLHELIANMTYQFGLPMWTRSMQALDKHYSSFEPSTNSSISDKISLHRFKLKSQCDIMTTGLTSLQDMYPMPISYVNAMLSPIPKSQITVLSGMLIPPYFHKNYDDLLMYAVLGSILGHELNHVYSELKEPDDVFLSERTLCVSGFYRNYSYDGVAESSSLSVKDDIADIGGLMIAYQAFKKLVAGKTLFSISEYDLDVDQMFFLAYAQQHCMAADDDTWRTLFTFSDHSPNSSRVKGPLSQMPEFAKAFSCPPDSPMNPVDKCAMW